MIAPLRLYCTAKFEITPHPFLLSYRVNLKYNRLACTKVRGCALIKPCYHNVAILRKVDEPIYLKNLFVSRETNSGHFRSTLQTLSNSESHQPFLGGVS